MSDHSSQVTRRQFVAGSLSALAVSSFPLYGSSTAPPAHVAEQSLTVQQIIDLILKEIPGPIEKTVDTIKAGNANQPVNGVVTTMFATVEVIRKAIDLKANFIIAHEPSFYNHLDETAWLEKDKVYDYKLKLLNDHNITLWRFHDYIHRHNPDMIRMGVMTDLGWDKYYDPKNPRMLTLPATKLQDLIEHCKRKLGIKNIRIVGDLSQVCSKILLMPGASGGRSHIQSLQKEEPDVLICGEVAEWETSEYIRDARAQGLQRSLVVLGHAQSEEPGMRWLVQWLQPKIKEIKVTHVPSNNPFTWA